MMNYLYLPIDQIEDDLKKHKTCLLQNIDRLFKKILLEDSCLIVIILVDFWI